jgi:hypothetical protein
MEGPDWLGSYSHLKKGSSRNSIQVSTEASYYVRVCHTQQYQAQGITRHQKAPQGTTRHQKAPQSITDHRRRNAPVFDTEATCLGTCYASPRHAVLLAQITNVIREPPLSSPTHLTQPYLSHIGIGIAGIGYLAYVPQHCYCARSRCTLGW